jgi:hypothetical protein
MADFAGLRDGVELPQLGAGARVERAAVPDGPRGISALLAPISMTLRKIVGG